MNAPPTLFKNLVKKMESDYELRDNVTQEFHRFLINFLFSYALPSLFFDYEISF